MGQKAHPYGLRLGYIKPWKARWYAEKNFSAYLHEDLKLRKFLKKKLGYAGIANIEIERSSGRVRVKIHTARPGVIIGRRGQEIDKIKEELASLTHSELFVDIKEVKVPQVDAQLVAENITLQLEKRVGFRRVMKKAIQLTMTKGALGVKILCKGRLGGAEIARAEGYREGKVPLNTFRADVDYGFAEAFTTYGTIGCKVWIYKGDILVKKEEEAARRARQLKELQHVAPEGQEAAAPSLETKKSEEAPVPAHKESSGRDRSAHPKAPLTAESEKSEPKSES